MNPHHDRAAGIIQTGCPHIQIEAVFTLRSTGIREVIQQSKVRRRILGDAKP
jgi:hypothetical protein